ncbi:hypothetical protein EDD86DRAFT_268394 [Gorgonomyces haynaldii]|nr:hypothetical protein EDD86DRAFT_268394 [Gorgonomyces haynaldii]
MIFVPIVLAFSDFDITIGAEPTGDCIAGTPVVSTRTVTACPQPTDALGRQLPSCSEKKALGYYCYENGFCCDKLGACFGCQGQLCQTRTESVTSTTFAPSCTSSAAPTATVVRGPPLGAQMPEIKSGQNPTIYKKCVSNDMWALTYDDGPSNNVPGLVQMLDKLGVKATFFVNGNNQVNLNNEQAKQNLLAAYRSGHQIASHTYQHADMATLSDQAMYAQIQQNDQIIYSIIGAAPRHFRFPYLSHNTRADDALASWGFKIIDISVDTLDFSHTGTQESVFRQNEQSWRSMFKEGESHISLEHDPSNYVIPWTEKFVGDIRALGYRLVTVAECIGDDKPYA